MANHLIFYFIFYGDVQRVKRFLEADPTLLTVRSAPPEGVGEVAKPAFPLQSPGRGPRPQGGRRIESSAPLQLAV